MANIFLVVLKVKQFHSNFSSSGRETLRSCHLFYYWWSWSVRDTSAWNPLEQCPLTMNKFQRTCFVWLKHKKIIDSSGAKNALSSFYVKSLKSFSNQDSSLWMYHTASTKCLEHFNTVIFCFHKWGSMAA